MKQRPLVEAVEARIVYPTPLEVELPGITDWYSTPAVGSVKWRATWTEGNPDAQNAAGTGPIGAGVQITVTAFNERHGNYSWCLTPETIVEGADTSTPPSWVADPPAWFQDAIEEMTSTRPMEG